MLASDNIPSYNTFSKYVRLQQCKKICNVMIIMMDETVKQCVGYCECSWYDVLLSMYFCVNHMMSVVLIE